MIYKKLAAVQAEMKAPKSLYNSFGGYKYRNAEQIFEAFKPYGKKYGLVLTVSDTMEQVGGYVYVKAKAVLTCTEDSTQSVEVTAYAREPENKKGMDSAQITGTCSSYARKYALNGLFLLDDTKDPDSDEYQKENAERQKADAGRAKKASAPDERERMSESRERMSESRKRTIESIRTMAEQKGYTINADLTTLSDAALAATLKNITQAPVNSGKGDK